VTKSVLQSYGNSCVFIVCFFINFNNLFTVAFETLHSTAQIPKFLLNELFFSLSVEKGYIHVLWFTLFNRSPKVEVLIVFCLQGIKFVICGE